MDELTSLHDDLAHLARLAAAESYDDVRLLLGRLVRKYRTQAPTLASRLEESLKSTRARSHTTSLRRLPTPETGTVPPVDNDSKSSLIRIFDDRAGLQAPLLPDTTKRRIETIVKERIERERLLARGIGPTKSAILVGPPGVGKTLSARWIAAQLGRPLWVLDLTAVMSSLLGKTGSNLRAALDYAKANEAVLLLDEIDAIAKRRNDDTDVGELKRLVTVILQEVDQWPDTGLLLAATNHPELIDHALWRRFDVVIQFPNPSPEAIRMAVERFLAADLPTFEPYVSLIASALVGSSLSDVERSIASARRAYVIDGSDPGLLVSQVAGSHIDNLPHDRKIEVATALAQLGYSHHEAHRLTGVSRDTIRKHAGPSPRKGRGHK